VVVGLALSLSLLGCSTFSSFDPEPIERVPFLERAQTRSRAGLTVTTALPSREEARRIFGVDLAEHLIQPVWFEIHNESDSPYVFLLAATDPNYFSAHEAAYRSHFRWRRGTNREMDAHFDALHLDGQLLPGSVASGFVFTNLKLGTKEIDVRLFGPGRVEEFEFYASVPGFKADYQDVDWKALLSQPFRELYEEDELRAALRALPCCTTKENGKGKGDPLNLVVIGSVDGMRAALVRSGWDETETLSLASGWRTFKAFFGGEYRYSPMSALYFAGRSQDLGAQKARDTIHQRNHLRLWLSDIKFRGQHVWVGTITRDIGVYFTWRTWNLTTHAIDPYVDEARGSVVEDFAAARSLRRFGYVEGVGAATQEDPHRNLMKAPWWTDGVRVVAELSETRTELTDVDFFYWTWAAADGNDEEINRRLKRLREGARSEWQDDPAHPDVEEAAPSDDDWAR
jgi:hypothetical protein